MTLVLWAPAALADGPSQTTVPADDGYVLDLSNFSIFELTGVPVVTLDLAEGVRKARKSSARKARRGKGKFAPPPEGQGTYFLAEGNLAFGLTPPEPKDLSGGATLNLNLPDGALTAIAEASVGKEEGGNAFWHKDRARLIAKLKGPLGIAVNAAGENRLTLIYRTPESLGATGKAAHMVRTESRSGELRVAVPLDAIALSAGATTTLDRTQEGEPGSSFAHSAVETEGQSVFFDLAWQRGALLKIEGGSAFQLAAITWQNASSSRYRSVNPHLEITLSPWRETTIRTRIEQVVSPFDAAAFAAYAKAGGAADASGFMPDHAWQLVTVLDQQLGPADVTATYTAARSGTATEFAAIRGVQAPAAAPLLARDRLSLTLRLTLGALGLPRTDFSSSAEWQDSRVVDPVTGEIRTASGDARQSLRLALSHQLPAEKIRFGLNGAFNGSHAAYLVNALSSTAPGGTLGAFIAYKPAAYEINLDIGGLLGTETRDTFFKGERGSSEVERSVVRQPSGPSLKLSLKRAF